ncbi:MAG: SIS domain-containing protein [Rhodospirillaceae bacterium]
MTDIRTYLSGAAEALAAAANDAALVDACGRAVAVITKALKAGRPVLVCGNGGSMADAQHIAGELTSRFRLERPGLPVIALGTNTATLTAWSNDYDYETAFAREVDAYGVPGGVLIGLSTSGNSKNVLAAAEKARFKGMTTIALTGAGGGGLAALADVLLAAPATDTPRIQEIHIALYHVLCEQVEAACAS